MIRPTINYFLSILSQLTSADNDNLLRPLERQYTIIIINITINVLHKKIKYKKKHNTQVQSIRIQYCYIIM